MKQTPKPVDTRSPLLALFKLLCSAQGAILLFLWLWFGFPS